MGCAESKRSDLNAPKLKQLDSLAEHRTTIDDFLQEEQNLKLEEEQTFKKDADERMVKLADELKGLSEKEREVLTQSWAPGGPKWDEVKNQARDEMKIKIVESQKANVASMWEEFDKNGDGVLDKDENRKLVGTYLRAMQKNFPEIVKFSTDLMVTKIIDESIALMRAAMAAQNMQGGMIESLINSAMANKEKELKQQHAMMGLVMRDKVEESCKKLVEDADKIADELLVEMDLDHDGKVVRSEFESCFSEVMTQVFSPEAIANKVQKQADELAAAQQKKLKEELAKAQEESAKAEEAAAQQKKPEEASAAAQGPSTNGDATGQARP